jgi:molybdate transport system ATP-binding protein
VSRELIVLDQLTVSRGGREVVRDLSWTIREGETWAVTGPIGSGKSTLAETLLGKHFAQSGSIAWPMLERNGSVPFPSDVIRHVAFQENSRLFNYAGHYYQQRFEFADADEPLTLDQYLRQGTGASDQEIHEAGKRLGIATQLPLSFIKLSNGQTRRARIARALLAQPELLILDDPFLGVDAAGREELSQLLGELVRGGLRLVLICAPEALPKWVTHRLQLEPVGGPSVCGLALPSQVNPRITASSAIIELRHVTVAHGGRPILDNISWTVRAGEHWAILGPNGSGKTTLLSLLCGDHPQAYSNDIRLFGHRRGSGESIWDVKRRVGLVSPEFHLYFTEPLTAERTAATGFFDCVTDRPTTGEQERTVKRLFSEFGIAHLAGRPFRQISTGEQRLVLLVRALVKRPPLLILDEPFQGLDATTMRMARDWLVANIGNDQTLLFVSHHEEEVPRTVHYQLKLNAGKCL